MKILYLDTSENKTNLGLIFENREDFIVFDSDRRLSEILLTKINKLLVKNKTKIKDLNSIAVFRGTGSFTGLRVGVATANALAFSLQLPIIEISKKEGLTDSIKKSYEAKKFKKISTPFYGKSPHITKPKKR